MVYLVGVMGASGYAGVELLRLLGDHPDFAVVAAGANRHVGVPIGQIHRGLAGRNPGRFVRNDDPKLLAADVIFSALPHGQSAGVEMRARQALAIVDLGADHRLVDAEQWQRYYGDATRSEPWTYGLPELPGQRKLIADSQRVANPGCYATAIQLALAPLLAVGMLKPDTINVVAASGTTGAGRDPVPALQASQVMGSMSAYKVGGVHQHIPEIEQQLNALAGSAQPTAQVSFTPLLAPMPRGIIAVCTARVSAEPESAPRMKTASQLLTEAYRREPFVTVLPDEEWPATAATLGTNQTLIQATTDWRTGLVTVVAVLDNLGKGAAGQAIQNANLMLGLPEGQGLPWIGMTP